MWSPNGSNEADSKRISGADARLPLQKYSAVLKYYPRIARPGREGA
jgi:hypothetical protein